MPRVTTPERFWARVSKADSPSGCWEWQGRTAWNGYGSVGFEGRQQKAHRISWQLTHGQIPDGLCVLHACDNPPCCNPAHLFLGTQAENNRDRHRKGRTRGFPGTRSHAKLSLTQIADARRMRAAGVAQQAIADQFGVSRGHVARLVKGVLPKNTRCERSI